MFINYDSEEGPEEMLKERKNINVCESCDDLRLVVYYDIEYDN